MVDSINGWSLYFHPLFIDQYSELVSLVDDLYKKHPDTYVNNNKTKILAAINKIIYEEVPQNPFDKKYRQGNTLGTKNKCWFRAKFFQQYRLFFRYSTKSKIIVYAWVNDTDTKRAYESKTDAYVVFEKILQKGNPPKDWNDLIDNSQRSPSA